jgi:phosphoribosylformimino-5-aminoimidazole carboxamide ribotide isomerase
VDLDAARHGRPQQRAVIERIVAEVGVPCQVAGGIRTEADVAAVLGAGADRVVLGSALIGDPDLARRLVSDHGAAKVVAALDVRGSAAVGDGWVPEARAAVAVEHAAALSAAGVEWLAVTAIARDGGMEGPDLSLLAAIRSTVPTASIIASGGVGSLADVRSLAAEGFAAVIVGRALYEGAFTIPEALEASNG